MAICLFGLWLPLTVPEPWTGERRSDTVGLPSFMEALKTLKLRATVYTALDLEEKHNIPVTLLTVKGNMTTE
jgi:hypothetical protein